MPGFAALNASATCSSTVTCSGASPVPRQQNQTMLTSPGLPVDPAVIALGAADASSLAAAEASLLGAADGSPLGAVLVVDDPQAPKISAAAAMRTPRRPTVRSMPCLRFRLPGELSVSGCTVALLLLRPDLVRTHPVRADDHPF